MNIAVCVKQVIDPEASPAYFKIDEASQRAAMEGIPPVIDPYGEYAVEAALKLKAATGAKVTVLTMGAGLVANVVKHPLAMGADALVLLEDAAFGDLDGYATAHGLAMAIQKTGPFDLILTGREASDTNAGQTGSGIAEILGLPCVTLARQIDIEDARVRVKRVITDGYEVVTAALPAVVTVSNEIGQPRYPSMKGVMAAKRIKPTVFTAADLGMDAAEKKSQSIRLFQPVHEARCQFVEGETPEEMAAGLAQLLRAAKIL